jgi:N-acetylmuramoyl-L-alanine amidase
LNPTDSYQWNVFALALMVWKEARSEDFQAKLAVAYVAVTRAANARWWGGPSITSVIFKKEQFSSLTNAGDPNLIQWPADTDSSWNDSINAAKAAIAKSSTNPAPNADSYVSGTAEPDWIPKATLVATIGAFRFYQTI